MSDALKNVRVFDALGVIYFLISAQVRTIVSLPIKTIDAKLVTLKFVSKQSKETNYTFQWFKYSFKVAVR